jgi:MinD superfamily P-loop ATPase
MILAVASGKGGTGKTTVSVNLAVTLGADICLCDCDVEEPNVHLFLKDIELAEEVISSAIPTVNAEICNGCGACGHFCAYKAIISFGELPLIFPELCHSCGGCAKVCPTGAITEAARRIGVVKAGKFGDIAVIQGQLDVGIPTAPPLIRAVKAKISRKTHAIIDAPPGTSCPVISALKNVDLVVLVTEPTPFGLHDLTLAVDMVRHLRLPLGVVINRVGFGNNQVHRFCENQDIPILAEIPDDRRIAEVYSRGELIVTALPEYRVHFSTLWQNIRILSEKL